MKSLSNLNPSQSRCIPLGLSPQMVRITSNTKNERTVEVIPNAAHEAWLKFNKWHNTAISIKQAMTSNFILPVLASNNIKFPIQQSVGRVLRSEVPYLPITSAKQVNSFTDELLKKFLGSSSSTRIAPHLAGTTKKSNDPVMKELKNFGKGILSDYQNCTGLIKAISSRTLGKIQSWNTWDKKATKEFEEAEKELQDAIGLIPTISKNTAKIYQFLNDIYDIKKRSFIGGNPCDGEYFMAYKQKYCAALLDFKNKKISKSQCESILFNKVQIVDKSEQVKSFSFPITFQEVIMRDEYLFVHEDLSENDITKFSKSRNKDEVTDTTKVPKNVFEYLISTILPLKTKLDRKKDFANFSNVYDRINNKSDLDIYVDFDNSNGDSCKVYKVNQPDERIIQHAFILRSFIDKDSNEETQLALVSTTTKVGYAGHPRDRYIDSFFYKSCQVNKKSDSSSNEKEESLHHHIRINLDKHSDALEEYKLSGATLRVTKQNNKTKITIDLSLGFTTDEEEIKVLNGIKIESQSAYTGKQDNFKLPPTKTTMRMMGVDIGMKRLASYAIVDCKSKHLESRNFNIQFPSVSKSGHIFEATDYLVKEAEVYLALKFACKTISKMVNLFKQTGELDESVYASHIKSRGHLAIDKKTNRKYGYDHMGVLSSYGITDNILKSEIISILKSGVDLKDVGKHNTLCASIKKLYRDIVKNDRVIKERAMNRQNVGLSLFYVKYRKTRLQAMKSFLFTFNNIENGENAFRTETSLIANLVEDLLKKLVSAIVKIAVQENVKIVAIEDTDLSKKIGDNEFFDLINARRFSELLGKVCSYHNILLTEVDPRNTSKLEYGKFISYGTCNDRQFITSSKVIDRDINAASNIIYRLISKHTNFSQISIQLNKDGTSWEVSKTNSKRIAGFIKLLQERKLFDAVEKSIKSSPVTEENKNCTCAYIHSENGSIKCMIGKKELESHLISDKLLSCKN